MFKMNFNEMISVELSQIGADELNSRLTYLNYKYKFPKKVEYKTTYKVRDIFKIELWHFVEIFGSLIENRLSNDALFIDNEIILGIQENDGE